MKDVSRKDHPFEGLDVDASSLGWAMSAVSSRAFRLHGMNKFLDGSSTYVPMMLPLVDMCNHSFEPNARIVQEHEEQPQKMLLKVQACFLLKFTLVLVNSMYMIFQGRSCSPLPIFPLENAGQLKSFDIS